MSSSLKAIDDGAVHTQEFERWLNKEVMADGNSLLTVRFTKTNAIYPGDALFLVDSIHVDEDGDLVLEISPAI